MCPDSMLLRGLAMCFDASASDPACESGGEHGQAHAGTVWVSATGEVRADWLLLRLVPQAKGINLRLG